MLSRSIDIGGDPSLIDGLFEALGIARRDRAGPTNELSFFEHSRNGALILPLKGDCSLFADIYLFDLKDDADGEAALHAVLAEFGKRGLLVVIPDEEVQNPFDSLVWSRRGLQYGYTVEPDDADSDYRFTVIYPPWRIPVYARDRLPPQWTLRNVLHALWTPISRMLLRGEDRQAWLAS